MIDKAVRQELELHDFGAAMISREKLKQRFKTIMSLDSHPGHISAGFAVGVFISFLPPIPGMHTVLALLIAFVFRLNKLTCLSGTWINSPITVVPSLILSYKLGKKILGGRGASELHIRNLDWYTLKGVMLHHSKPLLLGCSIIGFAAAVVAYFVCYRLVIFFRRKDAALAEITREMEVVGEEL
ncbi:MAG: DUF2062 domain-containing protein [Desulfobacteraceae bacterium]|nr:DUF2062 domain-containing protein [Desulfobacteraceae bacterium]